jgi:hypothetical protein
MAGRRFVAEVTKTKPTLPIWQSIGGMTDDR